MRMRNVTSLEVESYNYVIYRESRDQVHGNDQNYLRSFVQLGKNLLAF
jgi:hypothetical protein